VAPRFFSALAPALLAFVPFLLPRLLARLLLRYSLSPLPRCQCPGCCVCPRDRVVAFYGIACVAFFFLHQVGKIMIAPTIRS
jgi:hypothetical protein